MYATLSIKKEKAELTSVHKGTILNGKKFLKGTLPRDFRPQTFSLNNSSWATDTRAEAFSSNMVSNL
jgi:hypothetical protein